MESHQFVEKKMRMVNKYATSSSLSLIFREIKMNPIIKAFYVSFNNNNVDKWLGKDNL